MDRPWPFDQIDLTAFDELCFIAASTCNVPMASLCLLEGENLCFKARVGIEFEQVPLQGSLCKFAMDQSGILLVEDTTLDDRFKQAQMVVGGPKVRFYAGIPLLNREKRIIGTFCIFDVVPRQLSQTQIKILESLANQVVVLIDNHDLRLELKKNTEKFSSMINFSPDIISLMTKDGVLFLNSSAAERIHGYTNEEMIQKNTLELVHPEDREKVASEMAKLYSDPDSIRSVQYRYLNKDGSYIWMEATAINKLDDPYVEGLITVSRDITERKKTEQLLNEMNLNLEEKVRLRSEQLVNSEKVAFIGSHVAELVHNLNGPLSVLDYSYNYLTRKYPDDSKIPRGRMAVTKLMDIVKSILHTTAAETMRLIDRVDVRPILTSELKLLELDSFFKYSIEVSTEFNDVPMVQANPAHLSQCFGNLIKNAVESLYEREVRQLKVSTYNRDTAVVIEFADTGCGIANQNLDKIFDPFYTTKSPVAKGDEPTGTGLGLPSVKRMLESYQASLEIESELGVGSKFRVVFPV